MKQKIITLLVVIVIAGLLSLVVISSNNKSKQANQQKVEELAKTEPIFYYGDTCPHCKDVEDWLQANQVSEKMAFVEKEVYENQENATELTNVAASCGLDTSSIGVPFLYADGQCLIGSPDIIQYFAAELGIDTQETKELDTSANN